MVQMSLRFNLSFYSLPAAAGSSADGDTAVPGSNPAPLNLQQTLPSRMALPASEGRQWYKNT